MIDHILLIPESDKKCHYAQDASHKTAEIIIFFAFCQLQNKLKHSKCQWVMRMPTHEIGQITSPWPETPLMYITVRQLLPIRDKEPANPTEPHDLLFRKR